MQVTIRKLERHSSQTHYDRYVAKQVRAMQKARAKGHRDFRDWTDAQMRETAKKLADYYNVGEVYR